MNGGSLPQIRTIFPENIGHEELHFFSSVENARLSIVSQKFAQTFLTSLNRDNCLDRILTGENAGCDKRVDSFEKESL